MLRSILKGNVISLGGSSGSGKTLLLWSMAIEEQEVGSKVLFIDNDYGSSKFIREKHPNKKIHFIETNSNTKIENLFSKLDQSYDLVLIDCFDLMIDKLKPKNTNQEFQIAEYAKFGKNLITNIRKKYPKTKFVLTANTRDTLNQYGVRDSSLPNYMNFLSDVVLSLHKDKNNGETNISIFKNRSGYEDKDLSLIQKNSGLLGFFSKKSKVFEFEVSGSEIRVFPFITQKKYNLNDTLFNNFKDELKPKRLKKIYGYLKEDPDFIKIVSLYIFMKEVYQDKFDINYFDEYLDQCKGLRSLPSFRSRWGALAFFEKNISDKISCKQLFSWFIEDGDRASRSVNLLASMVQDLPKGYNFEEVFGKSFKSMKELSERYNEGKSLIYLIKQEENLKDFFENQEVLLGHKLTGLEVPKDSKQLIQLGKKYKNCISSSYFLSRLRSGDYLISLDDKYCIHFSKKGIIEVKKKMNRPLDKTEQMSVEKKISEIINTL